MQDTNTKKRVGILRGGMGEDYRASLDRGGELIAYISQNLAPKYQVIDIFVDKYGQWHVGGLPVDPADVCHKVDLVWNVSDHDFSLTLKNFAVPCIGQNSFASSLSNSDEILREHVKSLGVKMPKRIVLPVYQPDFDGDKETYATRKAKEIHEKFGAPWIVKSFTVDKTMGPVRGREGPQRPSASNGMGIHLAKTFPELVSAIEDGVNHQKSILVEEFIEGKVTSVHSVRDFRNDLPPVRAGGAQAGDFYTFPLGNSYGNFSNDEKEQLSDLAKSLHNHLDASHYLKSDFIVTPRKQVYLLGISLHPDVKPKSHFSEVVELVGAKVHHVIDHILSKVS